MDYNEKIRNCTSLDGLFKEWLEKSSNSSINHKANCFIADGIVDPITWNFSSKKRILFVLKEAYGDDWGESTLATWLHTHPRRRMWNRVARITYGIQNTSAFTIAGYKPELSNAEYAEALDQISVMNLKKSNGKSWSDSDEITEYAIYDRDELFKEFELIDPDIVICGSTFKTLYEVIFQQEKMPIDKKCDNWYYYLSFAGRNRLYIDYYHPAIHYADLLYYYGLVGIYQQALIEEHKSNMEKHIG